MAGLRHRWWKRIEGDNESGDWKDGKALAFEPCDEIRAIFLRLPLANHYDYIVLRAAANYLVLVEIVVFIYSSLVIISLLNDCINGISI